MIRLCDAAVVCRRSIASVAICTAVSKPKVKSVPMTSLSIVLGTPIVGTPSSTNSLRVIIIVCSPPIAMIASKPSSSTACLTSADAVLLAVRVVARGRDDRAAQLQDAADLRAVEVDEVALRQAAITGDQPDRVVAFGDQLARRRADDCVESGAVAAGGEDAYLHAGEYMVAADGLVVPLGQRSVTGFVAGGGGLGLPPDATGTVRQITFRLRAGRCDGRMRGRYRRLRREGRAEDRRNHRHRGPEIRSVG